MKHVTLVLFVCFTLFCCQKKETILETEKNAFNTVFNQAVDSIYLKLTGNKIISDSVREKTIVIYDSLTTYRPGYVLFKMKFNSIKNIYFDTISDKITQKIDLSELQKTANFKYKNKQSIAKYLIPENFWNSRYALNGILLFSKITFDDKRQFGTFNCMFTKGSIQDAKYFLIYIRKDNNNWKLDEVMVNNVIF